jgi:hypothetical protein
MKTNIYYATYANMNMKITWEGYGARLCLRLMLNKLKEMKGPISIYTPLGPSSRSFQGGFYVCIELRSFLKTFLIKNQLLIN